MTDYEKLGVFYLGRTYNLDQRETTDDLLLYDSKDLTTHAVCVGMTGSGKTGLCLAMLEEAAIDGLPAICIDPKGDIGNLMLTFPQLRPSDFQPWIDPADAVRKGCTLPELAEKTANQWRDGLAQWDEKPERIQKFRDAVDVAIYTPGSNAGIPLTVLKSFSCPPAAILQNAEAMRDRVSGTVSGLLALLGVDADPVKSREHILLSTLIDRAWREGRNVELGRLIREIQQPPFDRVGFLDLESFYPAKDRFSFVMSLNNLLASPGFQAWMQGESLDIQRLLYTTDGKPRISIISIAHLSDAERMFFVTILLNEMVSWMRSQSGTTALRALLYMDEIFGFFPPTANPPSKQPMLTLLKQARAFGVGCVLATQNPVDLDYKGLSNCGTWLIGRLQTERDKMRVLDGLEGASTSAGQHFDRSKIESTLSSLGSRVFLMNNVHEDAPVLFESRWCLSFLRGPLHREQIETLMAPRKAAAGNATGSGASGADGASASAASPGWSADGSGSTHPVVAPDVTEVFFERQGAISGKEKVTYQPALLALARVHFSQTTAQVDEWQTLSLLWPITDGAIDWDSASEVSEDPHFADHPEDGAAFGSLPGDYSRAKTYAAAATGLKDWLYRTKRLALFRCADPKATSKAGEAEGDFRQRLAQTDREARNLDKERITAKYRAKQITLEERLRRAQQTADKQKSQAGSQTLSAMISFGTSILGAMTSRNKFSATNISRAATSARAASRVMEERGDVARAGETVDAVQQQLDSLNADFQKEIDKLETIDPAHFSLEDLTMQPKKGDMKVERMVLAWLPTKTDATGRVVSLWE